ncbi:MAG TPA: metal-dependent hydrolase [Candidatus Acidoferrum sp.]|nr:metal-dependent hydrolase [Candidatus Acidoferrum sp.]
MDPVTHALTSFVLARGFFPRRPWWFILGMVLAGTIADLDLVSALVGPSVYLNSRHTFTHSILGTLLVILGAVGIAPLVRPKSGPPQKASPTGGAGIAWLLIAASLAALAHMLMDLSTSAGVALLWPWRQTRFALDSLPHVDPWILALLLAGILLPELFGLIGSEIGTKDKSPRGRNGAIVALALVLIYVGARATMHGNAVAQLDAHTFRGELPQRLAAFADPVSLTNWHGVVETTTQICMVNVSATESTRFDPESGLCTHKPGDSPLLLAAQQTADVKNFLQASRFPKASVGTTDGGTEIVLRDARDSAEAETGSAIAVRVILNRKGQVNSQEVIWASEARLR